MRKLVYLSCLLVITACGGGGGGGSSKPANLEPNNPPDPNTEPRVVSGLFIDAKVSGLRATQGEFESTTENGIFLYHQNNE
jgi:hypothetical protein